MIARGHVAIDDAAREEALQWIKANPGAAARLYARRLAIILKDDAFAAEFAIYAKQIPHRSGPIAVLSARTLSTAIAASCTESFESPACSSRPPLLEASGFSFAASRRGRSATALSRRASSPPPSTSRSSPPPWPSTAGTAGPPRTRSRRSPDCFFREWAAVRAYGHWSPSAFARNAAIWPRVNGWSGQ